MENEVENDPEGKQPGDLDEIYHTVADLQKSEFIEFLQSNAVVPFRLIAEAIRYSEMMSFERQRIKSNHYWDAVLLYVWFQHVKAKRENMGLLVDNELYASPSYIRNGLHWSKARYGKAVGVLKEHHLVSKHVKEWHNPTTGRFQTAQTWWAIWN